MEAHVVDGSSQTVSPTWPFASMITSLGLYWTGTGWSKVTNNLHTGTVWQFYQSAITGVAGPANATANELTQLGISYRVSNQLPPYSIDRATAAATGANIGTVNVANGRAAERFARIQAEARGETWI